MSTDEIQAGGSAQKLRAALLKARLVRNRDRGPEIPAADRTRPLPLSSGQRQMWFLHQLDPGSGEYLVPLVLRLRGTVDVDALHRAWQHVVDRHEILRTRYALIEGAPTQLIDPQAPVALPITDLTPSEDPESAVAQAVERECLRPIDLAREWPARAGLFRLAEHDHTLTLVLHHIACDAWSMRVLGEELSEAYSAFVAGGSPQTSVRPGQYADYAAWEQNRLSSGQFEPDLNYWRAELAGIEPVELPADRPRPARRDGAGGHVPVQLGAGMAEAVRQFAAERRTTPFAVLLAAFHLLVSRYTGRQDVPVGTVVSLRDRPQLQRMIGYAINTLVITGRSTQGQTFGDAVAAVRESMLGAMEHQQAPFAALVDELEPERELSRTPLFQVAFTLHEPRENAFVLPGLAVEPFPTGTAVSRFDLSLQVEHGESGELGGRLEYATALFDRDTMARMAGHYTRLLAACLADPDASVSDVDFLDAAERALVTASGAVRHQAPVVCVHEVFEDQALSRPDAVAVVSGAEQLSYRELNVKANQIANRLRALGVGPESVVGVCLERGTELAATLLAVLKAGGAYLPLDPAQPAERRRFMLADAKATVVVATEASARNLFGDSTFDGTTLLLDRDRAEIDRQLAGNPCQLTGPDNTIYVIYTSGSTGQPKGVCLTHANVLRLLTTAQRHYEFGETDVWPWFHSYAFDVSVWEMWGALTHGGRLVVVPSEVTRSPEDFLDLLVDHQVTVLNQTPSAFRGLVRLAAEGDSRIGLLALRAVVFAGERLEVKELAAWVDRFGLDQVALVNMYGITETTVHSTYHRLRPADFLSNAGNPIGLPLDDLRIHLLDQHGNPVPIGVPGEIHVGGLGVARGYLNRPELTARRFVPDPFGPQGGRLYRSGDMARWTRDRTLEFLGRMDDQVQIRGYRVELGEIEVALSSHPDVAEAVVVLREDVPGDHKLVGYVVPADGRAVEPETLRAWLGQTLPSYMVPQAYPLLTRIPLTVNGKLDRKALPAPDRAALGATPAHVPPSTPTERLVANIMARAVNLADVGARDDFFALGGDSISAVAVAGALRDAGLDVSVRDIFEHRDVTALAALADERLAVAGRPDAAGVAPFALIDPADRDRLPAGIVDAYPLSQVQTGMLVEMIADADRSPYHNVTTFRIRDERPVSLDALRAAAAAVVSRHEALRTSLELSTYSRPLQLVHESATMPVGLRDLRGLDAAASRQALLDFVTEERKRLFDTSVPALLRVYAHQVDDTSWTLSITECHAILEGWSFHSLLMELIDCYRRLRDDLPLDPPATATARHADFVDAELRALASDETRSYWAEVVGEHPRLELPAGWGDDPGAAGEPYTLQTSYADLDDGLRALAAQARVSLKSVLLAAHLKVLSQVTDQERFHAGLVCDARPELAGVDRVYGMFLNTLPFAFERGARTWRELVRQVSERETELWGHRHFPMPEIQRLAGGERLYAVLFNFQNFRQVDTSLIDVDDIQDDSPIESPLSVSARAGALHLTSDTATLSRANAQRIADMYRTVLTAMAADPDGDAVDTQLPPGERERLVVRWNDTARPNPAGTAPSLFEAQVDRTPQALAVQSASERVTYAELDERANRLARYLVSLGVRPQDRVGVLLPRSSELVVALLAVWKAGAVQVPLEPGYPVERIGHMLTDSNCEVVVTEAALLEQLPAAALRQIVVTDRDRAAIDAVEADRLALSDDHGLLAYIIYTSGSTGAPKGVLVTHGGLANYLLWTVEEYAANGTGGAPLFSSVAFDLGVPNLYAPLLTGQRVFLLPQDMDVAHLGDLLAQAAPFSFIKLTPGHLELLTRQLTAEQAATLAGLVIPAGDSFTGRLANHWRELAGPDGTGLAAEYGPTEITIGNSGLRVNGEVAAELVSIGTPIPNTTMYVLDRELCPLPIGVVGEVHVGGAGVCDGYANQPALTAGKFLPDPYGAPGARLYRTGDLARVLPTGEFEFVGRADHQVKIRGYRVELGEVTAALAALPGVRDAVAIARQVSESGQQLVGYLVSDGVTAVDPADVRVALAATLPEHAVPSAIVVLPRFPLTANGKVDLRALPAPDRAATGHAAAPTAPSTPTESRLAAVWLQVLELDEIGVHDGFFEVGGDSIRAVALVGALRAAGFEVSVQDVLLSRTIAELAERLARRDGVTPSPRCVEPFELIDSADRAVLPASAEDAYPLSRAQLGMVIEMLSDDKHNYHNVTLLQVTDELPVSVAALEQAVHAVVRRHDVLRTTIELTGYRVPMQLVHRDAEPTVHVHDLRGMSITDREAALLAFVKRERATLVDLTSPPPLRASVHLADGTWWLGITHPHAIIEGWSFHSMVMEIVDGYREIRDGGVLLEQLRPAVRYADFVAAELTALDSHEDQSYWQGIVDGYDRHALPDGWAVGDDSAAGELVGERIDFADLDEGLRALAAKARVSLKSVLLAAHLKVLSQVTDQERFHTGLVCSVRPELAGVDRVYGMFLNTVPFAFERGAPTWLDLVLRVFDHEVGLWGHRHFPMPEIQRLAGGERLLGCMFNYVDFHQVDADVVDTRLRVSEGSTEFGLEVTARPGSISLTTRGAVLSQDNARVLAEMYREVLTAMAADPLGDALAVRLPAQQRRQAEDTGREFDAPGETLHELVEAAVDRHPDAVAVWFDGDSVTFAELDRRANRLANRLLRLGVQRDEPVAVFAHRSVELVVGLLAVLKAGGAYLPVDPSYPAKRQAFMLADAAPRLLLTQHGLIDALPPHQATVVDLDEDVSAEPDDRPSVAVNSDGLAYLIYTSGSTGQPKAVMVSHRAIRNRILWMHAEYPVTSADHVLQKTPFSFDVSVWEFFLPLVTGARMVLAAPERHREPEYLSRLIQQQGVTTLHFVPSMLQAFLEEQGIEECVTVRRVFASGEALPYSMTRRFYDRLPHAELHNLYGPTEAAVDVTYWAVPGRAESDVVPIGRAVANTSTYVLDANLEQVPVGTPGELYLGGVQLARGYLGRPELTALRFRPDPFGAEGGRLYRTGDRVRRLPSGELDYLGRIDHQVQVRGFRVELGEIEAALTAHPAVREAVVLLREDVPGDQQLVAYVTRSGEQISGVAELRAAIAAVLPSHMIPSVFVPMDRIPLGPSGKVDRKALPVPGADALRTRGRYQEPQTPTERLLAGIWADVLGIDRVGLLDDFFELGGHSLQLVRVIAAAKEKGLAIPVMAFYQHSSLGEFAAAAESTVDTEAAVPVATGASVSPLLRAMRDNGVPGVSVAVISGGELSAMYAHGTLEAGGKTPVTPETAFPVGSVSKHVTAVGALRLVAEGLLDLDEDVQGYLRSWQVPEFDGARPRLTLRQLLGHLGGFALYEGAEQLRPDQPLPTNLDLLNGTPAPRLEFAPGEQFRKNNMHFWVVQQVMTDVTGQEFPELMRELVFEPLGMTGSSFDPLFPFRTKRRVVGGHDFNGVPLADGWLISPEPSSCGLWCTATDLAKITVEIQHAYHGEHAELLTRDLAEQMVTSVFPGSFYGLGSIVDDTGDDLEFGHGGEMRGLRALMLSRMRHREGYVVLTNSQAGKAAIKMIMSDLDFNRGELARHWERANER